MSITQAGFRPGRVYCYCVYEKKITNDSLVFGSLSIFTKIHVSFGTDLNGNRAFLFKGITRELFVLL